MNYKHTQRGDGRAAGGGRAGGGRLRPPRPLHRARGMYAMLGFYMNIHHARHAQLDVDVDSNVNHRTPPPLPPSPTPQQNKRKFNTDLWPPRREEGPAPANPNPTKPTPHPPILPFLTHPPTK